MPSRRHPRHCYFEGVADFADDVVVVEELGDILARFGTVGEVRARRSSSPKPVLPSMRATEIEATSMRPREMTAPAMDQNIPRARR